MKILCYEGSSGAWSWDLKDAKGHVIARGAQTYASKATISKGVQGVADALGKNLTEVVFEPLNPEPKADAS